MSNGRDRSGFHRVQDEIDDLRRWKEQMETQQPKPDVGWLAAALHGIDGKTIALVVAALAGTSSGWVKQGVDAKAVESRVEHVYREQLEKAEASAHKAWTRASELYDALLACRSEDHA